MTERYVVIPCHREAPAGYRCIRGGHDEPPCTLVPRWWNLRHFTHNARSPGSRSPGRTP